MYLLYYGSSYCFKPWSSFQITSINTSISDHCYKAKTFSRFVTRHWDHSTMFSNVALSPSQGGIIKEARGSLQWVIREMCLLMFFLDGHFSEESDEEDESDDDDIKLPGNLHSSKCYYFLSIKTICIYIKKQKR